MFLPLVNMAKIFINLLPRSVTDKFYNIKKLTKQLHKTASTIGFIDSKKYYEKLETIVKEGIKNGIYKETTDTTFKKIF